MAGLPLEGIRILELSDIIAVPHSMGMLADMGAQVIRIDPCSRLGHRTTGPFPDNIPGERFWNESGAFNWYHRNKLSLALNLNTPRGVELFKELVRLSDIVIENFTPQVMARWGLDYQSLRRIKPDIIMLSNTGWGHSGPWRDYPGLAHVVETLIGLAHYTGYIDGPPSRAGQNFLDTNCSANMAFALMAALIYRRRTGKGQWIDHCLYEATIPNVVEALLEYQMTGRRGQRWGNRHPSMAPHGCYRCRGSDRWVVITVADDQQWGSLCRILGRPEWAERFPDGLSRFRHQDEIDKGIEAWTRERDPYEVMETLQREGIPAGVVATNKDLLLDPHLRARGYFELAPPAQEPRVGRRVYPGRPWKMSRSRGSIRRAAPSLGQDNEAVLKGLLGLSEGEIQALYEEGVIGNYPTQSPLRPPRVTPLEEQKAQGTIEDYDPDYKEILARIYGGGEPQPG